MESAMEYFIAQVHRPVAIVIAEMVLKQKYRLPFRKNIIGNDTNLSEIYFLQHPEPGTVKPQ